ncbi:MAG: isochorismatase family protein [Desulfovibrionaceae bacterium]|jgi:nicotinamidase-related amidase|nr:isochorismatase family protein [Desulfovibrionaceae bacterium]
MKRSKGSAWVAFLLAGVLWNGVAWAAETVPGAGGGDVVALWTTVAAPEPPEAVPVEVKAGTTALLILDMEELTCNAQRRPRCLDTVAPIAELARRARAAGMPVLYSQTSKRTPFLSPVRPHEGEVVVAASVDKFFGTDLEAQLRARNVRTVIVTGTAAHGAVLHTATAAAQRGLQVVLPVDGLSAASLYTEQAAVWCLKDGPATRHVLRLTRTGLISIH